MNQEKLIAKVCPETMANDSIEIKVAWNNYPSKLCHGVSNNLSTEAILNILGTFPPSMFQGQRTENQQQIPLK